MYDVRTFKTLIVSSKNFNNKICLCKPYAQIKTFYAGCGYM